MTTEYYMPFPFKLIETSFQKNFINLSKTQQKIPFFSIHLEDMNNFGIYEWITENISNTVYVYLSSDGIKEYNNSWKHFLIQFSDIDDFAAFKLTFLNEHGHLDKNAKFNIR